MPLWLKFLSPYISLFQIGVWGIAQNLEGLHLFGYLNGIYVEGVPVPLFNLRPEQGVALFSLLFTPLLLLIFALNIRAAFHLNKKLGVIALLVWLLPGFLALSGIVFNFSTLGPDRFEYGIGFPGGIGSAAVNLVAFLVFGWSVVTLVGAYWKREQFKHVYDHIWYPLGIVAAVYFVTDASLNAYIRDFEDANDRLTASLTMYSSAVKNVRELCKESSVFSSRAAPLCKMAEPLQFHIDSHLNSKGLVRARMDNWEVLEIRPAAAANELDRAIAFANEWGCGQHPHAKMCISIPEQILQTPSDFAARKYLFPPSIYASATKKYQEVLTKYAERIDGIRQTFNIRYFAFLLVAFLAGGKVANSSRALLTSDVGRPKSWILAIVNMLCSLIRRVYCTVHIRVGLGGVKEILVSVVQRLQRITMQFRQRQRGL